MSSQPQHPTPPPPPHSPSPSSSPSPSPPSPFREPSPAAHSGRRTRPRLTEQIQIIRELWLLREQARVQAAERCFLAELERLLSGRPYGSDTTQPAPPPPPAPYDVRLHPVDFIPAPPAPPPRPHYAAGFAAPNAAAATASSRPGPGAAASPPASVTVLADGTVFESNPPPRSEGSPARERPNSTSLEMEATRSRQRVTNLSAQFRARLEGQEDEPDLRTIPRSRSFGELVGQRTVSTVLDSAFRHRLESVLTRREVSAARHLRDLYTGERDGDRIAMSLNATAPLATRASAPPSPPSDPTQPDDLELDRLVRAADAPPGLHRGDVAALETVVAALREEVAVLRNVVGASFDLQLDIQRSIRQEVAAAMSAPARVSIEAGAAAAGPSGAADTVINDGDAPHNAENSEMSDVTAVTSSFPPGTSVASTATTATSNPAPPSATSAAVATAPSSAAGPRVDVVQAGRCAICLEKPVDAMLYACGHMCTCAMCGRQLLASGQSCPICRAPVRDVVRAFVVTE